MVIDVSKLCRTKRSGGPLLMIIEAFDIVDASTTQLLKCGGRCRRRLVSHLPEEVLVYVRAVMERQKARVEETGKWQK